MWPFDQPKNCATIVSKSIINGSKPILHVSHDEDDHGWQFLDGASEEIDDLVIIGLAHILEIDPSMSKLANLQPGYEASRANSHSEWIIKKSPPEPPDDK